MDTTEEGLEHALQALKAIATMGNESHALCVAIARVTIDKLAGQDHRLLASGQREGSRRVQRGGMSRRVDVLHCRFRPADLNAKRENDMNAILHWLFVCLANHYADGYRHGYTQAMADAWQDCEKMLANMAETQAVLEGLMAKMEGVG